MCGVCVCPQCYVGYCSKTFLLKCNNVSLIKIDSLYSKMTMEVILSTAFGRSVDVQGGKGGEVYEAACDVFAAFNGKQSVLIRIIQFLTSEK